jgi:hypothetical protein
MFNRSGIMVSALLIAVLIVSGCGNKKTAEVGDKSGPSYKTSLWKKFDTPPGADPSVPDSMGGAGFEKIAANLGHQACGRSKSGCGWSNQIYD